MNDLFSPLPDAPVSVIQFGEGNFLRAFADCILDSAVREGLCGTAAVIKPRPGGSLEAFRRQNNRYTVLIRGLENGEAVSKSRIISSISRVMSCDDPAVDELAADPNVKFIISNTTEAGISLDERDFSPNAMSSLPHSFPAKLTKLLYRRYTALGDDGGVIILPTELIADNGQRLFECTAESAEKWGLPDDFIRWLGKKCVFCSTLVDRIVTGYPASEAENIFASLGYRDELLTAAEPFGLWVISCPREHLDYVKSVFPASADSGIDIVFTDDLTPYREMKVRLLNGAHTSSVLAAYLCGITIVRDMMNDDVMGRFCMQAVMREILPFVPIGRDEAENFAASVFERFKNPYIDHSLLAISLNSVSKWRARVLPSLRDYYNSKGSLPPLLTFSFAALLAFYSGSELTANGLSAFRSDGGEYFVKDTDDVLAFFAGNSGKDNFAALAASRTDFWGEDLTLIEGFADTVSSYLDAIRKNPRKAAAELLSAADEL